MKEKIDWVTRKFAYIYLQITILFFHALVLLLRLFVRRKKPAKVQSIATIWNYPKGLTGSNLRLGGWTKYFQEKGIKYDSFEVNTLQEYIDSVEKGTWTQRYLFFQKCYTRRIPHLFKVIHYDVIWIDRGFIPFFPRKTSFIETNLSKIIPYMVVDCTDGGDYSSNPPLVTGIFTAADKISVGYKYLVEFFEEKFDNITQLYWTIPSDDYTRKKSYEFDGKPVIGWMGSPGNFKHVLDLAPALKNLAKQHDFTFRYICRQNFDAELEGVNCEHHPFGDNYNDLLASFDIGISPFLTANLRTKGKIAMKHQEFLLMGTPQVCSPVALSEFVVHKEHAMIVDTLEEWENALAEVLTDKALREKLGRNSEKLFNQYYSFDSQKSVVMDLLLNFD